MIESLIDLLGSIDRSTSSDASFERVVTIFVFEKQAVLFLNQKFTTKSHD